MTTATASTVRITSTSPPAYHLDQDGIEAGGLGRSTASRVVGARPPIAPRTSPSSG
jgi:hypothetical protein